MGEPGNRENAENTPLLRPFCRTENDGSRNDGFIPQLFTSIPAFSEAASYLSQTTSFITGCFSDNSVEPDSENDIMRAQEMVTFSSGHGAGSLSSMHLSISGSQTTSSESSNTATATPPMHNGIARTSAGDSSQSSSSLVESNNSSNTASATPIHDGIARTIVRDSSQSSALIESNHSSQNGISIFRSLVERARRTVRGSADDIGWLQCDPEMSPVEDGTERFNKILENIRHGVHVLPKSVVYLLVPGLFSNHGPLYFVNTKMSFSKMGLTCHIAKIHSEASVEKNARELKQYIEEIYWGTQKRVLLLGHSKGGVDAAAALSLYWPDLKDKVAGLALAQSPYGGSPIASDILREGQLGDYVNVRKLMEILICKVIKMFYTG